MSRELRVIECRAPIGGRNSRIVSECCLVSLRRITLKILRPLCSVCCYLPSLLFSLRKHPGRGSHFAVAGSKNREMGAETRKAFTIRGKEEEKEVSKER